MRRLTIEQRILEEIRKGTHILLIGKHGVGKSYTARILAEENKWFYFPLCKPPRQIILTLAEMLLEDSGQKTEDRFNSKLFRRGTLMHITQLLAQLLDEKQLNIVLVLDEFHTVTANACSSYFLLMQQTKRITFFVVATDQYLEKVIKKPEMKRFFWELKEIEIEELDKEERIQLINELAPELDETDKKRIAKQSKGNILAIIHGVRGLKTEDGGQISGAIRDEGVNLFPLFIMLLVSMVAFRYLFRGMGDYEMASIASFIGLMALFFARHAARSK